MNEILVTNHFTKGEMYEVLITGLEGLQICVFRGNYDDAAELSVNLKMILPMSEEMEL